MSLEEQWKAEDVATLRAAFQDLAESKRGRRFLGWLLQRSGLWDTSFHEDSCKAAYLEGRRSIGIELVEDLRGFDASLYPQIIQEIESERANRDEQRASEHKRAEAEARGT